MYAIYKALQKMWVSRGPEYGGAPTLASLRSTYDAFNGNVPRALHLQFGILEEYSAARSVGSGPNSIAMVEDGSKTLFPTTPPSDTPLH